mmetsp:Transcript_43130/g.90069  ORF Transcript_43130/g.90069 Transcript_43130/m.90069 type:complete len:241 (+) Transcript_43130:285-1007(+)
MLLGMLLAGTNRGIHIHLVQVPPCTVAVVAKRATQYGRDVLRRESCRVKQISIERACLRRFARRIRARTENAFAVTAHPSSVLNICAPTPLIVSASEVFLRHIFTTLRAISEREHEGPCTNPLIETHRKVACRSVEHRPPARGRDVRQVGLAPHVVPVERVRPPLRHAQRAAQPAAKVLLLAAELAPSRTQHDPRLARAEPSREGTARHASQLKDDGATSAAEPSGAHERQLFGRGSHLP